jgi:hypothetical protein
MIKGMKFMLQHMKVGNEHLDLNILKKLEKKDIRNTDVHLVVFVSYANKRNDL